MRPPKAIGLLIECQGCPTVIKIEMGAATPNPLGSVQRYECPKCHTAWAICLGLSTIHEAKVLLANTGDVEELCPHGNVNRKGLGRCSDCNP